MAGPSAPGRHPRTAAVVVAGAVAALLLAACGSSGTPRTVAASATTVPDPTTVTLPPTTAPVPTTEAATTQPPTTTAPPPSSTTAATAPLPVQYEVLPLVDPSRPTTTGGRTIASDRSLPTSVWRPAAPGAYPLVVFAHGYRLGPTAYSRFGQTLAAAGFVVAAPSFPLADASRGNGLDRADIPNEATDVSFVITSLRSGPLADSLTPGPVAVVGHSDGADVALMDGYQQGKVDPRVGAVVAVAPDAMTGAVAAGGPPLLLVQGDHDSVVPYANSQQVFGQVSARRYYLTLLGADHLPPIQGGTRWTPVLDGAVASFLDGTLRTGESPAALQAALSGLASSRLQVAG